MTTEQGILLGMVAGLFVGLWPALKGLKTDNLVLGATSLLVCTAAGAALGLLLALPTAWFFAWWIGKQSA